MDTIAINANETLNENGQMKKKNKVSNTAKAAMATGAAGIAAGAAVKTVIDALNGDIGEEHTVYTDTYAAHQEEMTAEPTEESLDQVNPDDVMLDEPVAELTSEADMIAVVQPQAEQADSPDYQPFANNDRIGDDVFPEPQPEEILIAGNTGVDAVIENDSTVDLIIGLPAQEPDAIDVAVYPENELYADNGSNYDDSGIQADLMA